MGAKLSKGYLSPSFRLISIKLYDKYGNYGDFS